VARLDHVQLAMPAGREAEAVVYYEALLGIPHVPKPAHLAARGGCWFERGDLKIHLGVDKDFARRSRRTLLSSSTTCAHSPRRSLRRTWERTATFKKPARRPRTRAVTRVA
jgi:hypothetical protein